MSISNVPPEKEKLFLQWLYNHNMITVVFSYVYHAEIYIYILDRY